MLAWGGPELGDVVQPMGERVQVNWTELRIDVSGSAASGQQGARPVEELARRRVDAAMRQAVGRVPVAPQLPLSEAMASTVHGAALRARSTRWTVHEAVYGTSGRVWLRAHLSLHDLMKPWLLERATPDPLLEVGEGVTGVLVDARGLALQPAYAPSLVGPEGGVLYEGRLAETAAVDHPPARYVHDPAHPVAASVGPRPLIVVPQRAAGSRLHLGSADAEQLEGARQVMQLQGIVVVVDAE